MLSKEQIEDFGVNFMNKLEGVKVDCVIVAVAHDEFKKITLSDLKEVMKENGTKPILVDVRGMFGKEAEEKGLLPVMLYCGDHDPDGLRIGDNYSKMMRDIKNTWFRDGKIGYNPINLHIERFGLNGDWIEENNLTWIDNLITGSGKNLSDINTYYVFGSD